MAAFEWYGQDTGTADVAVGATDKFSFYGAAFNDAIEVSSYQDSSHVEDNANSEICSTAHLMNTKYIAAGSMDFNAGDGGALGAGMPTNEGCPLYILFGDDSAVTTSSTTIWAYDDSTDSAVPTGVTFQIAEGGNATWTNAEGSGAAMGVGDDTSAATHHYYFSVSASPESVGVKTAFAMKFQLTYS